MLTSLGLGSPGKPEGELRVGFRQGIVRSLGITFGGAGVVGIAVAVLELAQKEPQRFFDLLSRWGSIWLLGLAAMAFLWDLLRKGLGYVGRLSESVQESAIAMNRIADRDDREHDRLQTEVAFVGRRMQMLSNEQQEARDEMRGNHRKVVEMLSNVVKVKGHGDAGD